MVNGDFVEVASVSSSLASKTVLLTGAAGFIGFHCAQALLAAGWQVVGVDNLNDYYAVSLKEARLAQLKSHPGFCFYKLDIAHRPSLAHLFTQVAPQRVLHLAAQAGVRYSLENPHAYVDSNLVGFMNLLEGCRHAPALAHLVYASSSSVYGANTTIPFKEDQRVDAPVSLYGATKRANELLAYAYSHLYGLPMTGLRFFTVYGPWGRPDMAYFKFTRAILAGDPIQVFNHGQMQRDFTYIDDVVEGVLRVLEQPPTPEGGQVPHRVYNIGNHQPVALLEFIQILEQCLGKPAQKVFLPMQKGDVVTTYANVEDLMAAVGFAPNTPLAVGLARFVEWYQGYY